MEIEASDLATSNSFWTKTGNPFKNWYLNFIWKKRGKREENCKSRKTKRKQNEIKLIIFFKKQNINKNVRQITKIQNLKRNKRK